MQIFIEDAGGQELLNAIDAAPFSESFREAFGREVLASIGTGFPGASVESLFDCRDVSALATGDLCIKVRLTASGKVLTAALRALASSIKIEDHEIRSLVGVATPG